MCTEIKKLSYYQRNKEKVLAINARSRLKNAEKIKAHKRAAYCAIKDNPEFKARLVQYGLKTKDRKRAYDREYRLKNANKLDEIKKLWRSNNQDTVRIISHSYKARRRAIEKGGDSTKAITSWFKAQPKICNWCGCDCKDNASIDHIKALARGGEHRIANLCISCLPCNVKKNCRDAEEFKAELLRHRCDIGMIA